MCHACFLGSTFQAERTASAGLRWGEPVGEEKRQASRAELRVTESRMREEEFGVSPGTKGSLWGR